MGRNLQLLKQLLTVLVTSLAVTLVVPEFEHLGTGRQSTIVVVHLSIGVQFAA